MHSRSRRLALSTVVGVCLLGGCQAPAPTPAPVPTYRCTPEAGGAEFECTQQQYDEMVAKDKLYAEAEAVYRKFHAEDLRIARAGGASQPTSVLLETTSGFFLEDSMEGYRSDRERGLTAHGGNRDIKSVTRLVGVSKGGSVAALRVCTDSTSIAIHEKGRYVGQGSINNDDLYFGLVDSRIKIIGVDGEQVDSCGSV